MKEKIYPETFGAVADGTTLVTNAIQMAIDEASKRQAQVVLEKGIYLSGSLFLKSNIEFIIMKDAQLRGITDETRYPLKKSRVAGVEMEWPAGLLNCFEQENVIVSGEGTINGQGKFWWDKYWTMRKEYEKENIRWAVDYDCFRPRNVIVHNSHNVILKEFRSIQSGFWNVHLCYSSDICVDKITIEDNQGPSTDGIDIDSCNNVVVKNCSIDCNDDHICVKSGRDWDGLRVKRPCTNVHIEACRLLLGAGITLGSETSGGISQITVKNISFENSMNGFRIKSAKTRGGIVEDILVEGLRMKNVQHPFSFLLNWNPSYSYCTIPKDYQKKYPDYWEVLSKSVNEKEGMPIVRNITMKDVIAKTDKRIDDSTAFEIEGFPEQRMENITFSDVCMEAEDYGVIRHVNNLVMKDVQISLKKEEGEQTKGEKRWNI